MLTLECSLEEFKGAVSEFCKAAPSCDEDSLENGYKALGLMFIGLPEVEKDLLIAGSYLDYASRRKLEREMQYEI